MTDATTEAVATAVDATSRTLTADAWHTLRRRPDTIVAAAVLAFFAVVVVFPGLFTSADPQQCLISESKIHPQGFGATHPFGTDAFGCDMLAQLVYGARPSLLLAVVVVGTSLLIGVILGLLAGYYLGWVDAAISRSIEVFLVIPLLLAALLMLSLFRNVDVGSGTFNDILLPAAVLIMFGWMSYARYIRASVLETKSLDYVTAAKVLGASDVRVMFRHVLPNAIGPVTALVPTAIAGIIGAEAVLAFLGIGVRPPAISWGIMISNGAEWVTGGYAYLLLFPLGCLLITVLALVVLGDALRDALDPEVAMSPPVVDTVDEQTSTTPGAAEPPLLEVDDLAVAFHTRDGVVDAVDGLSYTVSAGRTLAIVGESGCGKSVSSLAVMGLLGPTARVTRGAVRFRGTDLLSLPPKDHRAHDGAHVAMVFQDALTALNPVHTVGYQLTEALRVRRGMGRREARRRAIELLDMVRVPRAADRINDYPHQFSGGMRQRAMIAAALAMDPEVLIADEPTTALDVTVQAQILRLLAEIQAERHMGLVLITHDLGVVASVADDVTVMYAGHAVEQATVHEIFAAPAHPYTRALLRAIPRLAAEGGRLSVIPGRPPRPGEISVGCPFHPRCDAVLDVCRTTTPPLVVLPGGRTSRCHVATEVLDSARD